MCRRIGIAGYSVIGALFAFVAVVRLDAQASRRMFVILPPEPSKQSPDNDIWQPTSADIESAEASLPQISDLKAENWGNRNNRIDHPEQYFRQYMGVIRSGQRQIYVNAFCARMLSVFPDWQRGLVQAEDGGTCFWQAFFNPAEMKYFTLRINGLG